MMFYVCESMYEEVKEAFYVPVYGVQWKIMHI